MILSCKAGDISIPYSSSCIIHTTGVISNGDTVSVTSPIFASTNFTSRVINMSERFNVPIRIYGAPTIVNQSSDGLKANIVCDDNDIFNMHVEVYIGEK